MKIAGLFIITIGCVFSADLPREAQRELDTFNNAVAKADAIRQTAVNAAVDKAVKAFNTVAKNADTAEERRAIDDEIFALKKMKVEEDLLGEPASLPSPLRGLLGKWSYKVGPDPYTWDFKADGTLTYTYKGGAPSPAAWEYRKTENVVHIQYSGGRSWDDILLPLDLKGTKVNNHFYGAGSGTAVKETK